MADNIYKQVFTPKGSLEMIFGKESTYDPMDAYTSEQKASVKALQELASTGTGGGLTLGTGYDGVLGSYDTAGQQASYDQLMSLYNGQDVQTARDAYTGLATNEFNPDDPSSGYAAFSRALAKSGQQSSDALNRDAAITGSRFSTAQGQNQGELQADLANQRGSYLAQLYQQGEQNKLAGASGLQGLVGTQGSISEAASQQAQLINRVKDQQALDSLNEFKRSRNEELMRIGLMQEQMQTPLAPVTSKSKGLIGNVLGMLGNKYLGSNPYAGSNGTSGVQGGSKPTRAERSTFGTGSSYGSTPAGYGGTIQRF